jgi:hypothetical protein
VQLEMAVPPVFGKESNSRAAGRGSSPKVPFLGGAVGVPALPSFRWAARRVLGLDGGSLLEAPFRCFDRYHRLTRKDS